MTPQEWAAATVRIATELLGWEAVRVPINAKGIAREASWFLKEDSELYLFGLSPDGRTAYCSGEEYRIETTDWPNLTTLDGCREFELALIERQKDPKRQYGHPFAVYLDQIVMVRNGRGPYVEHYFLATPEQRVLACLRVLDEMATTKEGK